MPEVNAYILYNQFATVRWVPASFSNLKLQLLGLSDIKQWTSAPGQSSGEQAFFQGIEFLQASKGSCHLSIPLRDFDSFHITIENASQLTKATKAHVYFQIVEWEQNQPFDKIRLQIVEQPKQGGKKTSAKSTQFDCRKFVLSDVEKIVSILFTGCLREER